MESRDRPTAARKSVGDFAPKLAQLTDDVLFGDVWERPELHLAFSVGWPGAISAVSRARELLPPK